MATHVSFAQLDALEKRWSGLGLTELLDHLEPGLTETAMDTITAPLGLRLPPELRTWFAWHDGAQRYPWTPANGLWPLAYAVTETRTMREVALSVREDPDVPEDDEWQDSWFAFTGADGRALFVDTAEPGPASKVYRWDHRRIDDGIPSVGQLALDVTRIYDSGYATYADGTWNWNEAHWPADAPNIFG